MNNTSLLEALASTGLNLLLDVGFNREVGENGAVYFNKLENNLSKLIDNEFTKEEINMLSKQAKERINSEYTWTKIVNDYEKLFLVK